VHQYSPVLHGWRLGQHAAGHASASDYASGDFYGGKYQHTFGAKLMAAYSTRQPFEFMTSRCVTLYDHTSMKAEEEMRCEVALTLANAGAFFFIDAINPDGTLVKDVYDRIGKVTAFARPFAEKIRELQPTHFANVGIYFSMPSHIDTRENGINLRDQAAGSGNMTPSTEYPPIKELLGTARALSTANIPYRVIPGERHDLAGLKALIVNNAGFLSAEEVESIRGFVTEGGTLIATGVTSLYNLDGETTGDFQLADVFGVSYSGQMAGAVSYLCYNGAMDSLPSAPFALAARYQYILTTLPAPMVSATTCQVLARMCGTHFPVGDPVHYASIHSNPPGPVLPYAGLTVNAYGKGRCIYLYSGLLASVAHAQQRFGELLFKQYAPSGVLLSCDAPPCVDVTVLADAAGNHLLLNLVNYQLEFPNVPVYHITATLALAAGRRVIACRRISTGAALPHTPVDGGVSITLPELETMEMIEFTLADM